MKKSEFKKLIKEVVQELLESNVNAFTPDQLDALKNMGFTKMKAPVPPIVDGQQVTEQLHLDSLELWGFKWNPNTQGYQRHYIVEDIDIVEDIYFSVSRPFPVVFVRKVKNANNNEGLQIRFSEFMNYEKLELILERIGVYENDTIDAHEIPNPFVQSPRQSSEKPESPTV
jgi:hypothetical protein